MRLSKTRKSILQPECASTNQGTAFFSQNTLPQIEEAHFAGGILFPAPRMRILYGTILLPHSTQGRQTLMTSFWAVTCGMYFFMNGMRKWYDAITGIRISRKRSEGVSLKPASRSSAVRISTMCVTSSMME